jgi:hypothetical protein
MLAPIASLAHVPCAQPKHRHALSGTQFDRSINTSHGPPGAAFAQA